MKRSDFFKALGVVIISPLAINSILKDNKCPEKRIDKGQDDEFCHKEKPYSFEIDESGVVYRGDVYILNDEHYVVVSIDNGIARLLPLDADVKPSEIGISLEQFKHQNKHFFFSGAQYYVPFKSNLFT